MKAKAKIQPLDPKTAKRLLWLVLAVFFAVLTVITLLSLQPLPPAVVLVVLTFVAAFLGMALIGASVINAAFDRRKPSREEGE